MRNPDTLATLRRSLASYELDEGTARTIPLGHGDADAALSGGLRAGALHEVYASDVSHGSSACGFAVALALRLSGKRCVFWIVTDFASMEFGAPNASGLLEIGVDPDRLILLRMSNGEDVLRAAADILACGSVGAVVIEISGALKALDLTASRRLSLAAAVKSVSPILLRIGAQPEASAAETRWLVHSAMPPPDDWGNPRLMCDCCAIGTENWGIGKWSGIATMDFSGDQTNTTSRRIMAIWLPRLPTDRLRRKSEPTKRSDTPLIIAAKIDNAMRIYALDKHASKLGLHVGQPLANARAMIDPLDVFEADEGADSKLLVQIADWCERFTPYVAINSPDALFLDVTGVTHLFGGERTIIESVATAVTKQGFSVSVAMAGTAVAACALSRFRPGTLVAPGNEAEAIAPLPVIALGCTDAITHALRRAGLKTIGQVAARQRAELCSRFGKAFVFTLERALGQSESPISPRMPLPDYMAEHRFAEPVTAEAVVLTTLKSLATTIAQVLEQRGQGARMLEAIFFRADGAVRRITLQTGSPTRDCALIERLFQLKIDALADPIDPGFGFDLIRLEVTLTQRAQAQSVDFDDDSNAQNEISQLVDTLSARFGRHRVLRFISQDTHTPEAASVTVPAQESMSAGVAWPKKQSASQGPRRPIRLLERPEPIEVVAEVPDGPPSRFRWRRVLHTAAIAEGPERIAMDWWRYQEAKPTRDYFRVQDTQGRRFWLYRDGLYSQEVMTPLWFMHGLFA